MASLSDLFNNNPTQLSIHWIGVPALTCDVDGAEPAMFEAFSAGAKLNLCNSHRVLACQAATQRNIPTVGVTGWM